MTPQNPLSDHDILIELRTLVQQILPLHSAALALKADKTEVAEAMHRLDAHQKEEERYRDEIVRDMSTLKIDMRRDMDGLKGDVRSDNAELKKDVKKALWIAAAAVGALFMIQIALPIIVKLI